jgi:YbbR domain-containing protein
LTRNIGLKITALVLALFLWFYVVNELNKGSDMDRQFLNKVLPSDSIVAKKLSIRPIFVGAPRFGYVVNSAKAVIAPEYCIVVGQKDLMSRVRYAYTMPIDVRGISKPFTKSVPLSPIAPGIFMEETLVQVTVPVDRDTR